MEVTLESTCGGKAINTKLVDAIYKEMRETDASGDLTTRAKHLRHSLFYDFSQRVQDAKRYVERASLTDTEKWLVTRVLADEFP